MALKVLTLWSAPYAGGAAKRFVELVDGLSSRGTDIILLSAHDYSGHAHLHIERISLPQGRFRTLRMKFSRRCVRDIETLFEKHAPDIVFAFGLANGSMLCALAQKHGIPSVLFVRGMELVPPEYRRICPSRIPVMGALNHALYVRLFRGYAQAIFEQARVVVFQNQEQYRAYLEYDLIPKDCPCSIEFLPNNSNPSWLPPHESSQVQRGPVTLIVANLFWGKGFKIALDAFQIVREGAPDAQLTILGEGPEGESIRRYASRIPGVIFEGHVRNVHDYFKQARLLVHPTLFELGSPNIVLEAAGSGLPMIVSDKATHTVGTKCWVYPSHNHKRLAELWIAGLMDDQFHALLCQESRELGEQYRFDWVGKAQDILNSSLAGTNDRSRKYDA